MEQRRVWLWACLVISAVIKYIVCGGYGPPITWGPKLLYNFCLLFFEVMDQNYQ